MKSTISVCYICRNENNLIFKASLQSVLGKFDEIIIIDGESTDGTLEMIDSFNSPKIKIIHKKWRGNDGLQRNEYLKYATGDWILVLDCDEVISDNSIELYNYIKQDEFDCFDIPIIHFVYSLDLIDATRAGGPAIDPNYKHYVIRRFFKNQKGLWYPTLQHPPLNGCKNIGKLGTNKKMTIFDDEITIYHYSLCKGIDHILRKSKTNFEKSKMHTKDFLKWWEDAVLFGSYPTKKFEGRHPLAIRNLLQS